MLRQLKNEFVYGGFKKQLMGFVSLLTILSFLSYQALEETIKTYQLEKTKNARFMHGTNMPMQEEVSIGFLTLQALLEGTIKSRTTKVSVGKLELYTNENYDLVLDLVKSLADLNPSLAIERLTIEKKKRMHTRIVLVYPEAL